jgi:hypothetical protein
MGGTSFGCWRLFHNPFMIIDFNRDYYYMYLMSCALYYINKCPLATPEGSC